MEELQNPVLPLAYPKFQSVGATGDWAVSQPIIDLHKCTKCDICLLVCPEGAIKLNEEDLPVIDYTVCKGCSLCAHECGPAAIDDNKH